MGKWGDKGGTEENGGLMTVNGGLTGVNGG